MAKQLRGLGKGLGEMLGGADNMLAGRSVQYINDASQVKQTKPGDVCLVDIESIRPNPFQPRVTFDPEALEELACSIRNLGLIQPITVRAAKDGKFQIISGERRYRASKMAGLSSIPAYIKSTDDRGMLEMAIVENVQRADLDPIETAMSYQRLIDECSLTQEQMADRIGKSRVAVTNYLRLLRLPAKLQYELKTGKLSVGHAKVLLGVEDKVLMEELCERAIKEDLSVRALEQAVREHKKESEKNKADDFCSDLPDDYYRMLEIMGKYFGNNIFIKRKTSGKGTLTVHFDSDGQVMDFLKALQNVNRK